MITSEKANKMNKLFLFAGIFLCLAGGFGIFYTSQSGRSDDMFSTIVMLAFGLFFLSIYFKIIKKF